MPILSNNQIYEKVNFSTEAELEKKVVELSSFIFGPNTIYLDIKKKLKGNNIGIIPDGYLIDMTISEDPKLFIIENELGSHDAFKHIGIQMLRFVTSLEEEMGKLRNIIMNEISNNKDFLKMLEENSKLSNSRNIDYYLDKAVYSEFKGLVIIDEANTELFKVLEKINANISVLELRRYKSNEGKYLYEFDTLYEQDEEILTSKKVTKKYLSPEQRMQRRIRRAKSDTIVVPARKDGFEEEFIKNNQWYAIKIGAAMKDRIKYIAAYQIAPISAVTHIAEIKEIKPYKDTGKYIVYFKDPARKIRSKKIKDPNKSPQGPVYVQYNKLIKSKFLDDAFDN